LFYYYQRKELDFIVDNTGIEVKWQNKVKRADFPLISISNKILLSKTDHQLVEADNLLILPVAVFLLQ
jgi:predicted AAA+ superfamily ATPase